MKAVFNDAEQLGHADMFSVWQEESEGEPDGNNYLQRYRQLHEILNDTM